MGDSGNPFETLTETQLARLFARLEVPMAVQAVVDGLHPLDEPAIVALHDMISAQTPDRALMSIGLSSIVLDSRLRTRGIRVAEILSMSAEMMVQDYAPLFLEQITKGQNLSLFDRNDLEFLATIPEDLESLADLLSVVMDVMPADFRMYRDLAKILSAQAGAQALVAEAVIEAMTDLPDLSGFDDQDRMVVNPIAPLPDNVVPFRRR
jgi:hypothetical protein